MVTVGCFKLFLIISTGTEFVKGPMNSLIELKRPYGVLFAYSPDRKLPNQKNLDNLNITL